MGPSWPWKCATSGCGWRRRPPGTRVALRELNEKVSSRGKLNKVRTLICVRGELKSHHHKTNTLRMIRRDPDVDFLDWDRDHCRYFVKTLRNFGFSEGGEFMHYLSN